MIFRSCTTALRLCLCSLFVDGAEPVKRNLTLNFSSFYDRPERPVPRLCGQGGNRYGPELPVQLIRKITQGRVLAISLPFVGSRHPAISPRRKVCFMTGCCRSFIDIFIFKDIIKKKSVFTKGGNFARCSSQPCRGSWTGVIIRLWSFTTNFIRSVRPVCSSTDLGRRTFWNFRFSSV